MKLNEDTFMDINSPKANKKPLKESVGRVLEFSVPVDRNGNGRVLDVDCENKKYYTNSRWGHKDDIRLTKRDYDKLVAQLKELGFTDGGDGITESTKKLTEKQWDIQVPKDLAQSFRKVITSEDYIEMKEPVEAVEDLLQWFIDTMGEDNAWEAEYILDDLNLIDRFEAPDDVFSEAQDDWDDDISNEEQFNFVLSELYDLFDSYNIWIPTLNESISRFKLMGGDKFNNRICEKIDQYKVEIRDMTNLLEKRTDLSNKRKKSITEEINTLQSKLKYLRNKCNWGK